VGSHKSMLYWSSLSGLKIKMFSTMSKMSLDFHIRLSYHESQLTWMATHNALIQFGDMILFLRPLVIVMYSEMIISCSYGASLKMALVIF